jgi:hypothetical protein
MGLHSCVIVNPTSGGGATGRRWPQLRSALDRVLGHWDHHFIHHKSRKLASLEFFNSSVRALTEGETSGEHAAQERHPIEYESVFHGRQNASDNRDANSA